jgi:hypothetical protein
VFDFLAGATGLEPAASGVTGRRRFRPINADLEFLGARTGRKLRESLNSKQGAFPRSTTTSRRTEGINYWAPVPTPVPHRKPVHRRPSGHDLAGNATNIAGGRPRAKSHQARPMADACERRQFSCRPHRFMVGPFGTRGLRLPSWRAPRSWWSHAISATPIREWSSDTMAIWLQATSRTPSEQRRQNSASRPSVRCFRSTQGRRLRPRLGNIVLILDARLQGARSVGKQPAFADSDARCPTRLSAR